MGSLIRMELLKLGKRPMTWVLLVLLLGGFGLMNVLGFVAFQNMSEKAQPSMLASFTLPGAITQALWVFYQFGTIMLVVLAACAVGAEYGWGTLRPMISTGMPRGAFLLSKLVVLAIVALVFMLLSVLMNSILAVPWALLTDHPVFTGTMDASWLGHLALMLGRTWLVAFVPMVLAFLFGVLSRSQAVGVGVALGYILGETIVATILGALGQIWTKPIVTSTLSQNTSALMDHNSFGSVPAAGTAGITEVHALIVLGIYALIGITVSLLLFHKRDIHGAV